MLDRPATPAETKRAELQRRYREACDLFPDSRVELIDGRIVVREVSTGEHNDVVSRLILQIVALVASREWGLWTNIKLFLGPQIDRYIPDLTIVPRNRRMWGEDEVYGDSTVLVVEVVSKSSVRDDHVVKPESCAVAGVPLYLVIDTFKGTARLLSRPDGGSYAKEEQISLGEPLQLPEPWGLTIDTGKLVEA
ncbi:Uma2 family endonuclease [Planotetraspora sp. A-T 1434]|uniref:Uma2 family endonuclease n=1 Tax=Planotetraspora sp. A-T 1434 TaxID=2979219 RepID=UPI0021BEB22F|nr:Uma2 family endonuclease [Planotetraspora sp. A-T 1434]MCT9931403.1 Uma2 family endonuclease [Planotetraspora sp. A-T 1434]